MTKEALLETPVNRNDQSISQVGTVNGHHTEFEGFLRNLEGDDQRTKEKTIIDLARNGSPLRDEALAWLYNAYFSRIYKYDLARTADPQQAEDLTQEVFIKMVQVIDQYEWRGVPFSAWLFRIAHNGIVSERRKAENRYRSKTTIDDKRILAIPQETPEPDEIVIRNKQIKEVIGLLPQLTDLQSRVVELSFFAQLSVAETAKVIGKSPNNTKAIQHRAITQLRRILNSQSETPRIKK